MNKKCSCEEKAAIIKGNIEKFLRCNNSYCIVCEINYSMAISVWDEFQKHAESKIKKINELINSENRKANKEEFESIYQYYENIQDAFHTQRRII